MSWYWLNLCSHFACVYTLPWLYIDNSQTHIQSFKIMVPRLKVYMNMWHLYKESLDILKLGIPISPSLFFPFAFLLFSFPFTQFKIWEASLTPLSFSISVANSNQVLLVLLLEGALNSHTLSLNLFYHHPSLSQYKLLLNFF